MDVTDTRIKSGGSLILAPRLSGADGKGSAYVPPVELMGRKRRIYHQHNPETAYTSDEMYRVIEKKRKEKQLVEYTVTVPYASWMVHSRLQIVEDLCGCGKVESGNLNELAQADLSFRPRLAYVVPEAEPVKARELSGKAFLDFRVNRTEIDPSYRQNPVELKRILASIDTVKNDRDFTVTEITIKGYASPEGSYAVNKRLAEGRTEALKTEINKLAKADVETQVYTEFDEQFQVLAWLALLLLAAELMILNRKNPLFKNVNLFKQK